MKRWITILLMTLLGLALLWSAGSQHERLRQSRQTYDLTHAEPLENAPPLVVFSTVALGGFSGIIADVLWVRAAQLQMDGQYFELVQLADWITKLQPRFPDGWVYHAWNLSYNISVMFDRPEDRWRWVRHGIELLRDGGLRYNPASPTLHRELGWIFQHKIGESTDRAHMTYKYEWAMEMDRLLGGANPDYAALERAPTRRAQLLQHPEMEDLIQTLQAAGFDPLARPWPSEERWTAWKEILDEHPAGTTYLHHVRLRRMEDRYKLFPERMRQIEAEIGPLDWRLPHAHAIYWAWSGRAYAEGFERLALDRMVFQSMAISFREGRLYHDPAEEIFVFAPHPDLLPYVMQAYAEAVEEHGDTVRTAHINFLNHALSVVYTYHRTDDARRVFEEIQTRYPEEVRDRDLEDYALALFVDRVEDLSDFEAHSFVEGAFYQSYFWRALGEEERAAGFERLARQVWHSYMEPLFRNAELLERTGLPPLPQIRRSAREQAREAFRSRAARGRLAPNEQEK